MNEKLKTDRRCRDDEVDVWLQYHGQTISSRIQVFELDRHGSGRSLAPMAPSGLHTSHQMFTFPSRSRLPSSLRLFHRRLGTPQKKVVEQYHSTKLYQGSFSLPCYLGLLLKVKLRPRDLFQFLHLCDNVFLNQYTGFT